jgi:hypothetical protein
MSDVEVLWFHCSHFDPDIDFFLAQALPLQSEPAGWKIAQTFRVHAAHIITPTRLFRPVSRGAQITYKGGGKV